MPLYHFDDRICSIRELYKGKVFFCLRSCHTWKKYWKILCEKCIGRRSYIKLTFFLWSLIVGLYFPFKIFPSKKKKRKEKKVKIKAWPKWLEMTESCIKIIFYFIRWREVWVKRLISCLLYTWKKTWSLQLWQLWKKKSIERDRKETWNRQNVYCLLKGTLMPLQVEKNEKYLTTLH